MSIRPPAAKTNTQQCSNTPIPEPEKRKRKKMKTSLHTCGTGTQELDFWKKRKQLCIPVFLPSSPPPPSIPTPHQESQRVSPAREFCQRVKDTSSSKLTVLPALLLHSYLFPWGWVVGLKVSHTRACVFRCWKCCSSVPEAWLLYGLTFPHNGPTDGASLTVICSLRRNTPC